MTKKRASPASPSAPCPACGAEINVPTSRPRQKLQCPQCRQIIVLEKPPISEAPSPALEQVVDPLPPAQQERIAILEARVADLERFLANAIQPVIRPEAPRKVRWIASGEAPNYTSEQADVLNHNLRAIRTHAIRIQFPFGDIEARTRAEWFTEIFARAQWRVRGPEDTRPEQLTASGLSLATCLPVSPEAAATYLAIRAAGFPLATIYDQDLLSSEERLIVA